MNDLVSRIRKYLEGSSTDLTAASLLDNAASRIEELERQLIETQVVAIERGNIILKMGAEQLSGRCDPPPQPCPHAVNTTPYPAVNPWWTGK